MYLQLLSRNKGISLWKVDLLWPNSPDRTVLVGTAPPTRLSKPLADRNIATTLAPMVDLRSEAKDSIALALTQISIDSPPFLNECPVEDSAKPSNFLSLCTRKAEIAGRLLFMHPVVLESNVLIRAGERKHVTGYTRNAYEYGYIRGYLSEAIVVQCNDQQEPAIYTIVMNSIDAGAIKLKLHDPIRMNLLTRMINLSKQFAIRISNISQNRKMTLNELNDAVDEYVFTKAKHIPATTKVTCMTNA